MEAVNGVLMVFAGKKGQNSGKTMETFDGTSWKTENMKSFHEKHTSVVLQCPE